jgi:hypothetical protein
MKRAIVTVLAVAALARVESARAQQNPPSPPPGTVTLPLTEYDRLLDRAARPPRRPEPPPVAAVVSRVEMRARAASGAVRGTATLEGEAFGTGPVKVPLLSGATVLDARLAGRPLPLLVEKSTHVAVVTGPRAFSVEVDWGTAIATEPGRASFALPIVPSAGAWLQLELPGDHADVRLEPGLVMRLETAGGRTVVEATLPPASAARLSWSSREVQPSAASSEARFLAQLGTLVTVGETELRQAVLVDLTVLQGVPTAFHLRLPAGYELTGVSGASIDSSREEGRHLTISVREARRHQMLVSLERAVGSAVTKEELPLVAVEGAQRESGELVFEGAGALELAVKEPEGVHRMDPREAGASLRALARQPLLAAFRYQRGGEDAPRLALDVRRFPNAPVLAAIAERAEVTTLLNTEGRTLTEVTLSVLNQAQPFLRLGLPEGASLLTSEVAGEAVKPARGADGLRVPLLRPGFRPLGSYEVKFVYVQSGTPLGRKGEATLRLARFDLPVSRLDWELFLPDALRVSAFDGDGIATALLGGGTTASTAVVALVDGPAGLVRGTLSDPTGSVVPGATVVLSTPSGATRTATTDSQGRFSFTGVPAGELRLRTELIGFRTFERRLRLPPGTAARVDARLDVGTLAETVTVAAENVADERGRARREEAAVQAQAASANVTSLQRRAAGQLPVRVDVPRSGVSYSFTRLLVLDEETRMLFRYKSR